MTNPLSLLYSEEVEYGCTLCGECCRESWRVPLDAGTRETLSTRDWRGTPLAGEAEADREFFVQPAPTLCTGAAFQVREGACVFLGEEGGCGIHRKFGPQAKGIVCRLFPYLFVEAPEGTYVGYSFCCRPVRKPEELARAEAVLEESAEAAYREASEFFPGIHYQRAPQTISLAEDLEISWNSYLLLEGGLLEILSRSGAPFAFHLDPVGRLRVQLQRAAAYAGGICGLTTTSTPLSRPPEREE